jgi:hypothetical protein
VHFWVPARGPKRSLIFGPLKSSWPSLDGFLGASMVLLVPSWCPWGRLAALFRISRGVLRPEQTLPQNKYPIDDPGGLLGPRRSHVLGTSHVLGLASSTTSSSWTQIEISDHPQPNVHYQGPRPTNAAQKHMTRRNENKYESSNVICCRRQ